MDMPKLNLPKMNLKVKLLNGNTQIFDKVRKRYIKLTPEEWVRQNFIDYLHFYKNYPLGLMAVEKVVKYNTMNMRADIVLYNKNKNPYLIVECKSPHILITQDAFYQIAKYNYGLNVNLLIVTNGRKHYCCKMDYINNNIDFLSDIPYYENELN
jgi:hypothetical protein